MSGLAKNAAGQVEGYEIFIKGLPAETTEESLRDYFLAAGEMVGAPRLMMDRQTGSCKGVGWITFSTEAGVKAAQSWSGCVLGGRRLQINAGKQVHTGLRPTLQAPGTHTPALCAEVIKKMVTPDPSGVYVDGTFGRGGHSRAILAALTATGRLHAFDMDPEAIVVGKELMAADPRFTIHHAPFSSMKSVLKPLGVRPAGVFFDLGISSPQFDDAHRGFRPEADGPLDLRFDNTVGVPAYEFLMTCTHEELVGILQEYGETTDFTAARRIADVIFLARSQGVLPTRTREFAALVAQAKGKEYQAMHPAKLTFQALRIHLNDEFGEMRLGIRAGFGLLREGGRIGLISWKHSECAIIVDEFRSLEAVRRDEPLLKWYQNQEGVDALPPGWSMEMDDVVRPSEKELQTNSRSRSALLHILRKRHTPQLTDLERVVYAMPAWSAVVGPVKKRKRSKSDTAPVAQDASQKRIKDEPVSSTMKVAAEPPPKRNPVPTSMSVVPKPQIGTCNHCNSLEHITKRCTFGAKSKDRFLPCSYTGPYLPCFWRRFIVPLSRADAERFDPADPRASGRADVGMRCISAGLFRSQGLRHNSQVILGFEASGHTLEVSGALARGLVPDEGALAQRARGGFDALLVEGRCPPDPELDPAGWCSSPLRGLVARPRSALDAFKAALRQRRRNEGDDTRSRTIVFLLDADGMPVAEACKQIRTGPLLEGVVAVIGDHRGLDESAVSAYVAAADAAGCEVFRVSLGGTTLLGSHAIAILQHYLDEKLHRCEVYQQIDYGRGR